MIELERISDLRTLMDWREEVITTVFGSIPDSKLLEANRAYYEQHVAEGSHIAYVAKRDGVAVGCGAICLTDELPSPDNPSGHCAYIMNIYVRSQYRNHGIAHKIVKQLINIARNLDCGKIYLETTDDGRPVYESLGFSDMPDMMKLTK